MTDKHCISIRPASVTDFKFIFEFIKKLESHDFDELDMAEIFRLNLCNKTIIYLVATVSEEIIGFISCHSQLLLHHNACVGEIQEFFVDEAWRGKKAGIKLLADLKGRLALQGINQLEVSSNATRIASHDFYQRNGFQESHKKFTTSISS